MNKTHRGSCACGHVTFVATFDLAAGTTKCNCTSCWKRRWWTVRVAPDQFRVLTGQDALLETEPRPQVGRRYYCKHCALVTHATIEAQPWNDGAYVSLNVATLDDLEPSELVGAPLRVCDGRANEWMRTPAEVRHL